MISTSLISKGNKWGYTLSDMRKEIDIKSKIFLYNLFKWVIFSIKQNYETKIKSV